jgi:mRNA deadenylase 3'-5' endonuclease subunit Ccr4
MLHGLFKKALAHTRNRLIAQNRFLSKPNHTFVNSYQNPNKTRITDTELNPDTNNILNLQKRTWLTINSNQKNQQDEALEDQESFKIQSFNILANSYLFSPYLLKHNFGDCEPKHLGWDNRKALIFDEIMEVNADIIC